MPKFARFIIHSKVAAYIAALLCIVAWGVHAIGQGGGVDMQGCLGLLLCIIVGWLSVKTGRELSFGDAKSGLPATLFFIGCAIAPQIIPVGSDAVHLMLFPAACYILLRTYRDRGAVGSYFLAFALVGVECLLAPSLLLALPCLVVCGAFVESLHGRTFFAALWGLLLPYWVVGSVLFLLDRTDLIVRWCSEILPSTSTAPIPNVPQLWAQLLWALLLAVPGSVAVVLDRTMRQQTSTGFRMLIVALVVLLATVALFPRFYPMLFPCVLLYASLLGSVFFARNATRVKNIYLVVLLFAWLLTLGYTYGTTL